MKADVRKKAIQGAALGLAGSVLALLLWGTSVIERAEYITWYWRAKYFAAPAPQSDRIKLILVDQASLDWAKKVNKLGWPWPREMYAPIIDFCRRAGARSVAFDVLYSEPSVYGMDDDRALGTAIDAAPAFASAIATGHGETTEWPEGVPESPLRIGGLEAWLRPERREFLVVDRAAMPIPEVAANADLLANVSVRSDPDSVFRRIGTFRVFDRQVLPSLAVAAYVLAERSESGRYPPMRIEEEALWVGGRKLPIDRLGRTILRFRGPSGTYDAYSAAAVIQSELRLLEGSGEAPVIEPETLQDCYVFVGFSAPGLKDRTPTPLSPDAPGVELHATQLDNLLSQRRFQDFMRGSSRGWVMLLTVLVAMAGSSLIRLSPRIWQGLLIAAVLLPLPLLTGFVAYRYGVWWPVAVQELGLGFAFGGTILVNYVTERREKAFVRKAFSHYLSPAVIARLLEDPSKLQLGGERRELSIFFSDLQGFSGISERLDPQQLTQLLNDYLSDMTDIVLDEQGTLDKYEGDAIIAFWNAPLGQDDHALRACRTALRCQRKLAERRAEFEARTGAVLKMRIGLNTGTVVVGNMGSRERFDYTMLGDAANLASRLEGANKAFGTYTMASEDTQQRAADQFDWRLIGLIRVVGRARPVAVYEIMGLPGQGDAGLIEDCRRGVELCRAGRTAEALGLYEKHPDDPVAQRYVKKLREDADWDGIWNLTEK